MKKLFLFILSLALLSVAGCTNSKAGGNVDIDLTALSNTMMYAEVNNIMTSPRDYVGKSIKMSGPYNATYYEQTAEYYHFVIIRDASACCASGLEFVWNGKHSYPKDYPKEGEMIEVTGVFGSYEELGQTYHCLLADEVVLLNQE